MRQREKKIGLLIMLTALLAAPALAADYSEVSTAELAKQRTSMQSASEQERSQFRKEWQKRMKPQALQK